MIRGIRNVEDKLLVVSGNQLYQITTAGVAIPRGVIPGVGRVSMSHNQFGLANQVAIDNGSARYVYNTQTYALSKVTDPSFPGSFLSFFVDGYLGYIEPQGRYWGHSDLADAYSYNTLDSYEAEGQPDRIVSASVSHGEVFVFGQRSTEIYTNSPTREDGFGPFQRSSTSTLEVGCAARFTPQVLANSIYFLDETRIVRRMDGYTPARISTAGIEAALQECTLAQIRAAWGFTWEDRGHKVYYLTVPGRLTFGFDVLSNEWHRRSAFGLPYWPVTDVVRWQDKCIAASSLEDKLYVLDWDYSMDEADELVRERVTGHLSNNRKRITVNSIEILANVGTEETVPVPFPFQPEGPTISGSAPDGSVGPEYAGYSYTITAGDAPVTNVVLRSGTLPPGLSLSNGGVLSGFPTTEGVFAFTIRAKDANGLWADLADSIQIEVGDILPPGLTGWRYLANVALNDTTNYSAPSFDDSAWTPGIAPFGNFDNPHATYPMPSAYDARFVDTIATTTPLDKSLWLRRHLVLSAAPAGAVRMVGYFDNAYDMYINGNLVASGSEIVAGGVDELISTHHLMTGDNVIAVRCNDDAGSASNDRCYFDFYIEVEP